MSLPQIVLENQFGEKSINAVLPGGTSLPGVEPIAAHTILGNNTASAAVATGLPVLTVANALPAKTGVTAITAETAATAITIALSTGDVYTDDAVNTAVNAALVTAVSEINAVITKANAILAALKVVS